MNKWRKNQSVRRYSREKLMCNDDIANLAPKKFFNSVFMGEIFSPIDMYDQLMEV